MYTYPKVGTTLFRKVLFVAVLVETCACSPRDACYPGRARHLTPLYVPVSPCAWSARCKPCPMALVPDSTVHCSRLQAGNLDLSSSDHAQGPCVGFIYIQQQRPKNKNEPVLCCKQLLAGMYFSSMHPVLTAAQSTTITEALQSKGQK